MLPIGKNRKTRIESTKYRIGGTNDLSKGRLGVFHKKKLKSSLSPGAGGSRLRGRSIDGFKHVFLPRICAGTSIKAKCRTIQNHLKEKYFHAAYIQIWNLLPAIVEMQANTNGWFMKKQAISSW